MASKQLKVITIIGARPQFVKAAVVSRAFKQHKPGVKEIIVHTGQHFDANMSDVFFDELEIPKPDYYLGIGGGSHGQNTGRMLEAIESLLLKEQPNWVLVYGDTDSTLAGALAAAKLHIPVAHVEAGLRSFNKRMPEELNRILTDHVSTLLFTPTSTATQNLIKEGFEMERISQVGDVMYDAAMYYKNKAVKPFDINLSSRFILSTIHRAENTDDPEKLRNILEALDEISEDTQVVMPIHPRTQKKVSELGLKISNIKLIDPVGYLEMIWLLKNCDIVVTDSGGLQKEAYFFEKYCVTTREETEWVELVISGANVITGSDKNKIHSNIANLIDREFKQTNQFFGNGNSKIEIVTSLT